MLCNPRAFIDKAHLIEDRLEGVHLDVLTEYKKKEINPGEILLLNKASHGLALWMDSLTKFCDHAGLLDQKKRSKYGPRPK